MIFDVYDDTSRGMSGEYGQWNVWDSKLNKYVLFIPTETLPSVTGDTETFDNNVTTSRTIGKIKGKRSLDNKDVTNLWHRDNVERLNQFLGRQYDFLVSYKDGTGWKFSGEITYRNDDGTASDKLTGTVTIIPSQVDDVATSNVYDLMAKTCVIANAQFPSEIKLAKADETSTSPSEVISVQFSNASATCEVESDNTAISVNYASGKITITTTSKVATSGLIKVTPKATGEASWVQYILVIVE